jgi:peptidoglycan/xylan/chitin deacetylase (PgdA/CDA1 family)
MRLIKIKSPLSFALALLLVASFVSSTFTAFNAYAAPLSATPRVSFTFDDGLSSALTNAAPVLAAHGLTGTNYVITNCVGSTGTCAADPTASYMTWDQIAQLNGMGWEIASHTVSHPQLSTDGLNAAQLTNELVNSQATLKSHGYAAIDLAFPYGDYDNNVLAQTAKYYESARGFADLGYNTWPYNNSLVVNQQVQEGATANGTTGVTYAQVKAYIDAAITNKQWLVLTFHNVVTGTATGLQADAYATTTALLDQIAAYVQQQQTAGAIKSVNVTDGLVRGTNMLPNGTFNNGIADGWTTDDAVNITANAGNNGRFPDPTNSISLKSATAPVADGHLFSPQVAVTPGNQYIIKNYLNMLGGEVDFFVDEYDAAGTYISGQYHQGIAYSSAAGSTTVGDVNFGYVPTSALVAKARLQVIVHGASVNAYYDGAEWLNASETSAPSDTIAPVISGVATAAITGAAANATWLTDEMSTSQVEYGTTATYGSITTLNTTMTTNHSVALTGLAANTTYHYRVISKDAAGNTATSGDFTFTTTGTTTTPKPGDIDGNGVVNDDDATIMFANWGPAAGESTTIPGDVDHNGVINDDDATILFANWSK